MRTVMRSSANKEVEAIVVQTVDRIGPHANDSLCLVRANIYHRRGPCIGVARSTHSFRPSATSRKRSPVQQPNATGAQPSPARISRAVTAGPVREVETSSHSQAGRTLCDVSLAYSLPTHTQISTKA